MSPTRSRNSSIWILRGQCGNNLFVVFSGTVDIFRNDRRIAVCRVGDAFGEMSVMAHLPQEATAVAADDARLFALSERSINEILSRRVAVRFLLNVIHLLCRNFTIIVGDLAQLEIRVTRQRRQPVPAAKTPTASTRAVSAS